MMKIVDAKMTEVAATGGATCSQQASLLMMYMRTFDVSSFTASREEELMTSLLRRCAELRLASTAALQQRSCQCGEAILALR